MPIKPQQSLDKIRIRHNKNKIYEGLLGTIFRDYKNYLIIIEELCLKTRPWLYTEQHISVNAEERWISFGGYCPKSKTSVLTEHLSWSNFMTSESTGETKFPPVQ